jgi:hypothetical protein
MEVGQGPNWGCSAKEKKKMCSPESCVMIVSLMSTVAQAFSRRACAYFRFLSGGLVCILMLCSWRVLV